MNDRAASLRPWLRGSAASPRGRAPADPAWRLRWRRRARSPAHPEPGFFRLRRVKRGPWLPALIWVECPFVIPEPASLLGEPGEPPEEWCRPTDPWRGPRWHRAEIDGADADPLEVWVWGQRITPQHYHHLVALRGWQRRWEPETAAATRPADLKKQPSLF